MRKIITIFFIAFVCMVAFYFMVLKPEKYEQKDLYEQIMRRGKLVVGINTDSKPFGFYDEKGCVQGYDADLARYIAEYIVKNRNKVEFVSVTPSSRLLKVSTGEVDIVIATMTITPQREAIIDFSVPYDIAGQAILVPKGSRITSIGELSGQNVGVIFGTTAEKNIQNMVQNANVLGFKTYHDAYVALKNKKINAITSDDTILKGLALNDKDVVLLPKRYSREPYGVGMKKGPESARLKQEIDYAINDLKQKNVISRLHKKWGI